MRSRAKVQGRATLWLASLVALLLADSADAATGKLQQKSGTAACVAEIGGTACTDGVGLSGVHDVTVSPDGENAYGAALGSNAVTVFDRDPLTGALTQKAGGSGCISLTTGPPCTAGRALGGAQGIEVSSDGAFVYVAASTSDAVVIFNRDPITGTLTQKSGNAGCITSLVIANCATGAGLDGAAEVALSPDGKSLYVASHLADSIAVFDRDPASGVLTQKSGTAGCISETGAAPCADGTGLDAPFSVTVSPDGTNVYAASNSSDAVVTLHRDPASGALSQDQDGSGCTTDALTTGCVNGRGLDGPTSVALSPDGESAYVTTSGDHGMAIFDRDPATGALAQLAGAAGCFVSVAKDGCGFAAAMVAARGVTVAPDGGNVYAAAQSSNAVAVFDRDAATGALSQKAQPDGCWRHEGTPPCSDSTATAGPVAIGISPDGASLYLAAISNGSIAVFDRDVDPLTTLLSGPTGTTADNTPTFTFSSNEAGVRFECRFDSGAFAACSGPAGSHTSAPLTDGPHSFEVRAVDTNGNADLTPASQGFSVDATAPRTQIDSGPAGTTADNTPTFGFSANEPGVSFECRIDGGPFGACSGPGNSHTSFALADGPHSFVVRGTDPLGNVEVAPASRDFTVDTTPPPADTTPPDTRITSAVKKKLRTSKPTRKVKIAFESEPGASFECRIDQGDFAPCTSPYKPKATSAPGKGEKHKVEIRATDAAGNVEATPARAKFRLIQTR